MNRKMLAVLAVLLTVSSALAGSGLVLVPSLRMQWTMTLKSDDGEAGWPSKWEFVKTGELTRIVVIFPQGVSREYWKMAGHTLAEKRGGGKIHVQQDNPHGPESYPFAAEGFYGVPRINPAHEQGTVPFDGITCRYFRGRTPLTGQDPETGGADYEAWFDGETGLPKAYRERGQTFTFTFSPTQPPDLVLPSKWKTAWTRHLENLRKAGLASDPAQTEFPR